MNPDRMSEPLDNPISEPQGRAEPVDLPEIDNGPSATLPEVLRGRMFCVMHGRQCYRGRTLMGESVWVCPDERHSKPLTG